MKGFIIICALALVQGYVESAKAEDMLIAANNANGIFVITDQACKRQGVITKSTSNSGNILWWGCAMPVAGTLWKIVWSDGAEIYTDIANWSVTNAFTARYSKANGGRMASDSHLKKGVDLNFLILTKHRRAIQIPCIACMPQLALVLVTPERLSLLPDAV